MTHNYNYQRDINSTQLHNALKYDMSVTLINPL